MSNDSDRDHSVLMIMALYNPDGTMKGIVIYEQEIGAGATAQLQVGMNMPQITDGWKVKVFLWDDFTGMKPYLESATIY